MAAPGLLPAASAFDWLNAVPWALTALGIAASLAWNYFNYNRTTRLQQSLRQEAVRLEEFRRIRTPIDTALIELVNERSTLRTLASSGLTPDELRNRIAEQEKSVVEAYLRLQTALERANSSSYASGDDWLQPVERLWDAFASAINAGYNPNRREAEVRASIGDAASQIDQIARAVETRMEQELQRYTGRTANG